MREIPWPNSRKFAPDDYLDPPPPCAIPGCGIPAVQTIAHPTTADGGRHLAVITLYVCRSHRAAGVAMLERDLDAPDATSRLDHGPYHISIEGG